MQLDHLTIVDEMAGQTVLGHLFLGFATLAALESLGGRAVGVQVFHKLLVIERLFLLIREALMFKLKITQEVPHQSAGPAHLELLITALLVGAGFLFISLVTLIAVKLVALGALFDVSVERNLSANCAVQPLGHGLWALLAVLKMKV